MPQLNCAPRHASLAIIIIASLAPCVLGQDIDKIGIDNSGQINTNYFRGGQPNKAEFARLKGLGIKTVVDLQSDGKPDERDWAHDAGMQYFNIPLSSKYPATSDQTRDFLKIVNDPQNWPVYVHCAGGRHRTGEMTAIYRITHDLWTANQAFAEMLKYDYYSWGGHGSLKDYVFKFYQDFLITRAAADRAKTPK